ncbi:macrophage mannose receptor 1 [Brachionus plicatilis]|uniref:Macrophage mannose receptor 1 n=1 Tax=Brachionus plicatilis TaxID=10195 RepID=A0A3M7QX51_BRAPC|nr:macrophage mannose receptor 1 [Brachionus plicatilis]
MIAFLLIFNLIQFILCQHQQKPLPSPSFGRVFNKSMKTRSFDNNLSACSDLASYGFIQRAGTNKYYAIADIQMNWIDAENYCQSFGAHLPVAASASDTNFFRWFVGGKFMNPSYSYYNAYIIEASGYWLGLYKSFETNSWRWIDDSPLTFSDWDKNFIRPQPEGGLMYFAFDKYEINPSPGHKGWHDCKQACGDDLLGGHLCSRAGTNKYYAIADIQMNWIDAENYCQSFGAHLPVAASASDTNFFRWFVGGKFMNPSYEYKKGYAKMPWSGYWLGLYKSFETKSWRWIDDSPLTFSDWDKTFSLEGHNYFAFDKYEINPSPGHKGWYVLAFTAVLIKT